MKHGMLDQKNGFQYGDKPCCVLVYTHACKHVKLKRAAMSPTDLLGRSMKSLVIAAASLAVTGSVTLAQTGQPSYQADPDTYKLIFEDQNFRVIATTWKAGNTDKPHTHPVPGVAYHLTDCNLKIHNADGTIRDITNKAGAANPVPVTAEPHRAENPGSNDCHSIIIERK